MADVPDCQCLIFLDYNMPVLSEPWFCQLLGDNGS